MTFLCKFIDTVQIGIVKGGNFSVQVYVHLHVHLYTHINTLWFSVLLRAGVDHGHGEVLD